MQIRSTGQYNRRQRWPYLKRLRAFLNKLSKNFLRYLLYVEKILDFENDVLRILSNGRPNHFMLGESQVNLRQL